MGIIAAGMVDGQVILFNPLEISRGGEGIICSLEHHTGAVQSLHFNPHIESSTLLASGGSDGEVYIISLEDAQNPVVFAPADANHAKHSSDVTKVVWNTQVAHILASASQNGSCFIWDLKQKKVWCELRDPSGAAISDVAWHPEQGFNIVTASGEDKNPVIKLWDLRTSTSQPLVSLQGHSQGVLSISWCPADASLLISCGKDNRTLLWDLFAGKCVFELPSDEDAKSEDLAFGAIGNAAGQRKYHVSWSPCLPAVIATCSFDRRVQFFSLSGVKSNLKRAPKWLRRPVGATFGFGGKLVQFSHAEATSGTKKPLPKFTIYQTAEDLALVADSDNFHKSIASGDFMALCDAKAKAASDPQEKEEWSIIKVLCFEPNTREKLIEYLGFSKDAIDEAARGYSASFTAEQEPSPFAPENKSAFSFTPAPALPGRVSPTRTSVTLTVNETAAVEAQIAIEREAEPIIRGALVVGNFAAAVECCLEAGLMAEALLLAQCGDSSLWEKTQKAFFERQKRVHRLPFLDMLQAVIRNELRTFVQQSDLSRWRETLALLSTYGTTDEFPIMCELLARRLETESANVNAAKIAYMCSMNFSKTISLWVQDLKATNLKYGAIDNKALWKFITKVVVFTQSMPNQDLGLECAGFFSVYAHILASHGRFDTAPRYIRGEAASELVLRDRVFHAGGTKTPGLRAPDFPFERVQVNASVGGAAAQQQHNDTTSSELRAQMQRSGSSDFLVQRPQHSSAGRGLALDATALGRSSSQASQPLVSNKVASQPIPNGLPAGWIQLVDPNSGRPYYANQATGQTQWDPPMSALPEQTRQLPPQQQQPTMHSGFPRQTQTPIFSPQTTQYQHQPHLEVATPSLVSLQGSAVAKTSAAPLNPTQQQQLQPQQQASITPGPEPAVATTALPAQECESIRALHQIVSILEGICR